MKSHIALVILLSVGAVVSASDGEEKPKSKMEKLLWDMEDRKMADLAHKVGDMLDDQERAGTIKCDRDDRDGLCKEKIPMEALFKKLPCCKMFMLYENAMSLLNGGPVHYHTDNLNPFKDLLRTKALG